MSNVARIISALIAAVLALLGLGAPTQAVAMLAPITATTYAYDAPHHDKSAAGVVSERGPPVPTDVRAGWPAVDLRSHGASVRPRLSAAAVTYAYDGGTPPTQVADGESADTEAAPRSDGDLSPLSASQVAAKGVDIGGAKFAQRSFSETFSKGGLFGGRTIDDVAGALRSGAMSPKDVALNVVVRDGHTLITNTRSAQALTRAGIPRDSWNVINRTGDPLYEKLLSGQLSRNGLGSAGVDLP